MNSHRIQIPKDRVNSQKKTNSICCSFERENSWFGTIDSFGWQTYNSLKPADITIGSPSAAEIIKYGNNDVSLYKGVPNISIPIYTINLKDFSLPINLTYDASGVKVDQIASEIGLNWTLMAGGAITSVVYSEDDVSYESDVPDSAVFVGFDTKYDSSDYVFAYEMFKSYGSIRKNLKNDIFYFKAGGISGKFLIDKPLIDSPTAMPIPYSGVKIIPLGSIDDGFKIYDERGNVYYFEEVEYSFNASQGCVGGFDTSSSEPSITELLYKNIPTYTWHLSKIETTNGDILNFEYLSFSSHEYMDIESHRMFKYEGGYPTTCPSPSGYMNCKSKKTITPKVLKKIIHERSKLEIEFTYSGSARSDFGTDFKSLNEITIKRDGRQNENFQLTQSYFGSGSTQRLKLEKVQKDGYPPHEFTYNEFGNLPERGSYSQDIWGFYNGAVNNGLVPNLQGAPTLNDRNVDTTKSQYWSLVSIKYPTGGYTDFNMEADPEGGGLRAKTIQDYDGMGNILNKKTYSYVRSNFYTHDFSDEYSIWQRANGNTFKCTYSTYNSTSIPIPNVLDTPDYGYTDVTILYDGGEYGKSKYKFSTGIGRNRLGNGQGNLLEESYYKKNTDGSYALIKKVTNSYESEDNYSGITSNEQHHTENYYPQLDIQLDTPKYIPPSGSGGNSIDATFRFDKYMLVSSWEYLKSSITKIYNPQDSTKMMSFETSYAYEDSLGSGLNKKIALRTITQINSNNEARRERYNYAFEQYTAMENSNMLSQPYSVETINPLVGDSVLSKNWKLWKLWTVNGNAFFKPCGTWVWDGVGTPTAPANCVAYLEVPNE